MWGHSDRKHSPFVILPAGIPPLHQRSFDSSVPSGLMLLILHCPAVVVALWAIVHRHWAPRIHMVAWIMPKSERKKREHCTMANGEEAKQIGEVAHKEHFFFYLRFLTSFRWSQDFIWHQPVMWLWEWQSCDRVTDAARYQGFYNCIMQHSNGKLFLQKSYSTNWIKDKLLSKEKKINF